MKTEILFSVTAKDCRWDYFKGTGKGGQKRNKTESGVRCTHLASGAIAKSDDTRDQHKNKRIAFVKMSETDKFKNWHRIEVCRCTGKLDELDKKIDMAMRSKNLVVEKREDGLWVEAVA